MEEHYDSNEEGDHHEMPSEFQGIDPEDLANMGIVQTKIIEFISHF